MNFKSIAIFLSFLIFNGCASGYARFNSKTNTQNLSPIKKILIFTNAKSEYFNENLNKGFESSFSKNLKSCGINVLISPFDKKDPDLSITLKTLINEFSPDTFMLIKSRGGKMIRGLGGNNCTLYFDSTISDLRNKRTIWKSRIEYHVLTKNLFSNDKSSGERFGSELYEKLIADGVLLNCNSNIK